MHGKKQGVERVNEYNEHLDNMTYFFFLLVYRADPLRLYVAVAP